MSNAQKAEQNRYLTLQIIVRMKGFHFKKGSLLDDNIHNKNRGKKYKHTLLEIKQPNLPLVLSSLYYDLVLLDGAFKCTYRFVFSVYISHYIYWFG